MSRRFLIKLLFAIAIVALPVNLAYAALTPAGTQIKNSATVNYRDANDNPKGEVKSNEVVTIVSTLRGVDITPNPDSLTGVSYSAGTTDDKITDYAFTITNTGNEADSIALSLTGQNQVDGWKYQIYWDSNGNGQLDGSEGSSPTTVTNTGTLPQGGAYNAIVRVSAPALPDYNKSDSITLTATSMDAVTKDTGVITLNLSSPVVSISKDVKFVSGPIGMPGGIYSYVITVRNSDMESEALNVEVGDELEPALELVAYYYDNEISTFDVISRNRFEWTIPRLAPNSTTTLTIRVKIWEKAQEGLKTNNLADMKYQDFNSNTYYKYASSSEVTVLFKAGLEIEESSPRTIEVDSGGRAAISFYLVNTGNGRDSLFVGSSPTEWRTSESIVTTTWELVYDPRDFAAGERRRVIAYTTVPADALDYYGGLLEISATSFRDATVTATKYYEVRVIAPVLTLEKTVNKESAKPGDTLTYMLMIYNEGHGRAASAVLVDAIPDNTTYVAGSIRINNVAQTDEKDADQADFDISNAGAVTVNIPIIAPRARVTIFFSVTVD